MGIGNLVLICAANSRTKQTQFRELETLNLVRAQVAEAHGWVSARFLQLDSSEKAVRFSQDAFTQDLARIRGGQGLPLELLDSLRLLSRSRYEYLDTVIEYNRAQFQLWAAPASRQRTSCPVPFPWLLLPTLRRQR